MDFNLSPENDTTFMMDYGKFKETYEALGISIDIADQAWGLLTELVNQSRGEMMKTSQNLEEWLACVLYITTVNMRPKNNSESEVGGSLVTLNEILVKTNTSFPQLFKNMKVIGDVHQMTQVLEENLIALERKYCITCPIFNKFEKMFEDIFLESSEKKEIYKLCWTLFVYIKSVHYAEHTELVVTFELLVCCFIYVMKRTPSFQLKSPYDVIVPEPNGCHYMNELCSAYGIPVDDIPNMLNSVVEPCIATLPQELGNLKVDKLTEMYLNEYRRAGDMNELLFMEHHQSVTPSSVTNEQKHVIREESMEIQSSNQTPPETPVSAALQTVHNLRSLLQNSPDGPSSKLQEYFENCSANPATTIMERLSSLQDVFIRRFVSVTNSNQKNMAQQRYLLSVRLYFRVLETLLIAEEERLSVQDFSHLLNNPTFHTCLLACAVEVVLVTYEHMWMPAGPSMMAFPWVLSVFEIHGYDFYKVLESFIKAEPSLTKEVVKHLQEVETKILESMAWESGSPLYDALRRTESVRIHLPPPSPRSVQSNSSLETTSAAQLYLSPIRHLPRSNEPSPVRNTHGSMDPPQSPGPKRKSNSLTLFYNKVSRLAFMRLKMLCDFLKVHSDLQGCIWTCVQHIITQKSDLMRDRHLDQIILCCIYSICKVKENEIKFKTIVAMYKNLPHASTQVYKNALIAENRYDSIIGFYNQIFMHNLKSYILSFASPKQAPSMSPVPNTVASPITKSPVYKLPGWNNFFVSPLKSSPFKCPLSPNQMTPRSRQLYSFGECLRGETGSAEKLKAINESVKASKHALTSPMTSPRSQPRSQKCLKFDTSPGEENTNSSSVAIGYLPVKRVFRSKVALSFEDPDERNGCQTTN